MTLRVTDAAQLADLEGKSGIARDVLERARFETIHDPKTAAKISGKPQKAWNENAQCLPALRIPYFGAGETDSTASALRLPKEHPFPSPEPGGKPSRYLRPKGFNRVYLSPGLVEKPEMLTDSSVPKIVTEGEKKALCACSYGVEAIAISGVDCWGPKPSSKRARKQLHPELALVARSKSEVFLVPDADQATNWHVASSMGLKLADELARAGARVFMVRLPEEGPKGLDDLLGSLPLEDRRPTLFALLEKAKNAGEHQAADVTGGRVAITIGTDEDRVADETIEALAVAGDRLNLYRRGTMLARVSAGEVLPRELAREASAPSIAMLARPSLREAIAKACWFQRIDEEGESKAAHVPDFVVSAVMERGEWKPLRRLTSVTEVPHMVAGGRVVQVPGYDEGTGIHFAPRVQFAQVPERPTAADVASAKAALEEVVCDYRFEAPAHRASWFALVLTLLARFSFNGPAPLFLVDANTSGAGKGLLVDAAALIATGRCAALSSFTDDNAEMVKCITAWAMAGTQLIALDNVSTTLGGDALCKALTTTQVDERILGESRNFVGELTAIWCATANNAALGVDMHRRIAHVRVLADENPEQRVGFKHSNLRAWLRKEHPRLAIAALTILRAAALDTREVQCAPWNGFEAWSAVIRRTVVWAGWADPAEGLTELRSMVAGDRNALQAALVARWSTLCSRLMTKALTAKRALLALFPENDAQPCADSELREVIEALCGERPTPKKLGAAMRDMRARVFGGRALHMALDRNGVAEWSVVGSGAPLVPVTSSQQEEIAEWVV